MIDATRQLRWYVGLALVFFALAPLLMMVLAATDAAAPSGAITPVLVGGPFCLVGAVVVIRGMIAPEPGRSARLLKTGAAVVLAGVVLLYGIRAMTPAAG